jgi:hypothetical protein
MTSRMIMWGLMGSGASSCRRASTPLTAVWIPRLPPTAAVLAAARPLTAPNGHGVSRHDPWYRYAPESSIWHRTTLTYKTGAFSAATEQEE